MKLWWCLSLLFVFKLGFSQEQTNSLLWRITGNGLNQPSYLFGTFHVKDKRIFLQNDSLKNLIAACDYFSLELHPDSMNALLFQSYNGSDTARSETTNYFSDEEYKIVDEKLRNDIGVSLDQIKNKNLKFIKSLISPSKKRKDDYPTFLDGYLLNIAKRNNREIIGLESTASQASALNYMKTDNAELKNEIVKLSTEKYSESRFEDLVKYYKSENIELIHQLFTYQGFLTTDIVLYKRNHVMARTIDSIVKKNTLFAACGSAHLAGKEGVIQLLRDMGYKVSPVLTNKKSFLNAEEFTVKPELTWQKVSLPSFGVNYFLPGEPLSLKKTAMLAESHMYMDISSGSVYLLSPINISAEIDKNAFFEKMVKTMKERMYSSENVNVKNGTENGFEYREMDVIYKGFNVSIRFFMENNIFYNFIVTSPLNYNIAAEKKYFFSNISFYGPVKQNAYQYTNSRWEFEMLLPGKPVEVDYFKRVGATKINTLTFKLTDNISNIHYIFEGSEAGEGRFYNNDTSMLNTIKNKLKEQTQIVSMKDTNFTIQGHKAKQLTAVFDDNSVVVSLSVLRGFKSYNLLSIMPKKSYDENLYKASMSSFGFLNMIKKDYTWQRAPMDTLLYIKLPEAFSEYDTDEKYYSYDEWKEPLYTSYETNYGMTYYLQRRMESPYYYTTSDSLYWKSIEDRLLDSEDSLVSSKELVSENLKGRQICVMEENSTCFKFYNIYSFGKYRYEFFSYLPNLGLKDYLLESFNSIQYKGKVPTQTISDTVACAKLLDDYVSGDSVFVEKASKYLSSFRVTPKMLPMFQKAIDVAPKEVKEDLIIKLLDFEFEKTLPYIKTKLFTQRSDSAFDDEILYVLSKYKTEQSFKVLKDFLIKHTSTLNSYSSTLWSLTDTLQLAKSLYPDIALSLKQDTSWNGNFMYLTKMMLDSAMIDYSVIKPYEELLIEKIRKSAVGKVKDNLFWDFYFPINNIELIFHSPDQATKKKVIEILKSSNNIWGKYYSIHYPVKAKMDIDQAMIEKLCSQPYFRNSIYTDLADAGKMEYFPTKYLNRLSLAEGDMIETLVDSEEFYPSEIKYVKEISVVLDKKEAVFCIFKLSSSYSKDTHIGFTGPYYEKDEVANSAERTGLGGLYKKGAEELMLKEYLGIYDIENLLKSKPNE